MALLGVLGNGTKVGYSASSPVSWQKIGQLMNIDQFLQLIPDDVDTTVMGTSSIRTTMNGLTSPPEFTFTLLSDHDPATSTTHEALRKYSAGSGDATEGATVYWRIEVPVDRAQAFFRAWEFQGVVKQYTPSTPIDDKQTTAVTVRFSGGYWVGAAKVASAM